MWNTSCTLDLTGGNASLFSTLLTCSRISKGLLNRGFSLPLFRYPCMPFLGGISKIKQSPLGNFKGCLISAAYLSAYTERSLLALISLLQPPLSDRSSQVSSNPSLVFLLKDRRIPLQPKRASYGVLSMVDSNLLQQIDSTSGNYISHDPEKLITPVCNRSLAFTLYWRLPDRKSIFEISRDFARSDAEVDGPAPTSPSLMPQICAFGRPLAAGASIATLLSCDGQSLAQ